MTKDENFITTVITEKCLCCGYINSEKREVCNAEYAKALYAKNQQLQAELEQSENAYNEMCGGYEAELKKYRWIPVEEKLPEIYKDVANYRSKTVLITTSTLSFVLGWYNGTENKWENTEGEIVLVSHWMAIPEKDTKQVTKAII